MNISPRDLLAEYLRFSAAYPFVHDVEAAHALPPFTLFAVASRETNMVDEIGDGGHGRGAWQLDDRSHRIPQPFPVAAQADIAASMLVDLRHRFGDWISAYNAYNSGQPQTRFTAHGDYGPDVDQRRAWLAANATPPAPPPAPAPPAPPVAPVFFDLDGVPMVSLTVTVPTDANGNGWTDAGAHPELGTVDVDKMVAATVQGSAPARDDRYWPGSAHWQNEGGHPLVSVTGALPNAQVNVFVVAAT